MNERRKGEIRGKPSFTDSYTALHYATRRGNAKAVSLLIEYKADVNVTDGLDWTPLHNAAQEGNLEIVKMLVKAGAKLDAKTTPLRGGIPPGSPATDPSHAHASIVAMMALRLRTSRVTSPASCSVALAAS